MPNTSVTLSPIPRAADHPSRRQRRLLEISNEIAVDKTTWSVISVAGDEALMRLARNDRAAVSAQGHRSAVRSSRLLRTVRNQRPTLHVEPNDQLRWSTLHERLVRCDCHRRLRARRVLRHHDGLDHLHSLRRDRDLPDDRVELALAYAGEGGGRKIAESWSEAAARTSAQTFSGEKT